LILASNDRFFGPVYTAHFFRRIIITTVAASFSLSFAFGANTEANQPVTSAKPTPVPGFRVKLDKNRNIFDETYRFTFFATLEGLYRDGVSKADVESLLATDGKDGGYLNFIYTCPICMPVEAAIETYAQRPRIDHLKFPNYQGIEGTFGFGLPKEVSEALSSESSKIRLKAVNELVSKWVAYRMEHSGMTSEEKKALVEDLKKKRKEGMDALQGFAQGRNGPNSMKAFAAGYADGDECAICNAALQMPLKLKER
jgi:hypothetical protein